MGGGDSGVADAAPHAELNTSLRAHEMVRKPQRYRFNGLLQGERYDEDFHVSSLSFPAMIECSPHTRPCLFLGLRLATGRGIATVLAWWP
jgi:hypothetical protein